MIRPALDAGQIVVADRYLLANVVYQGHAGGLDPEEIWRVGNVATQNILPDCVFLLDMDPASASGRLDRPLDRMESQGDEYRRGLRAGFLKEAGRSERIHVIEAGRPVEVVQAEIWRIAAKVLDITE